MNHLFSIPIFLVGKSEPEFALSAVFFPAPLAPFSVFQSFLAGVFLSSSALQVAYLSALGAPFPLLEQRPSEGHEAY